MELYRGLGDLAGVPRLAHRPDEGGHFRGSLIHGDPDVDSLAGLRGHLIGQGLDFLRRRGADPVDGLEREFARRREVRERVVAVVSECLGPESLPVPVDLLDRDLLQHIHDPPRGDHFRGLLCARFALRGQSGGGAEVFEQRFVRCLQLFCVFAAEAVCHALSFSGLSDDSHFTIHFIPASSHHTPANLLPLFPSVLNIHK